MMNVGLIFWAAEAAGDDDLRRIALEHCRTSAAYLVRPDGGTVHEALFDPDTGRFVRHSTQQGWSADTVWSRGLAWAIYGFTAAFRLSGETEFRDVAERCARFFLHSSTSGLVPYWDYGLPDHIPHHWDSSAAAIAASGLWDLGESVSHECWRDSYHRASLTILRRLSEREFLPRREPRWEGILKHAVYHYHKGLGVDESVAWGDHFFVEALVKVVAGNSAAAW
jgi:unsaturated chondroitin disaccharide hydrolase